MFTYRKAVARDVPNMVELLRRLFSIEKNFNFHPGKHRAGLLMMMHSNSCRIFLAETDGRVVAMCTIKVVNSAPEGDKVGMLEDMLVDESFRRQGTGSFLLEKANDWAKESGLKRVEPLAGEDKIAALKFHLKYNWSSTKLAGIRN